jgi:coenzyme F420-dependent glucose-6-phosphate dehydrogenase
VRYWTQLATEQFPPSDIVRQAVGVEAAGFDALNTSDHFQPWWEPGEAGHAWVILGAIGQATGQVPIGRLFAGERFDHEGRYFRTKQAYLHSRGERRPPIYVSAFGPRAAGVAARRADGVWTLADPERAPEVIEAYKAACDDAGKEPGEVILQTGFSWAEDDDAALEACRVWKGAQPDEYYTDDWHIPEEMYRHGEEQISDEEFKEAYIVSSDPQVHVERIRAVEQMGPTVVCLQNASGADPHAALRVYGEKVLPALRG